jgi:hypothetical protein
MEKQGGRTGEYPARAPEYRGDPPAEPTTNTTIANGVIAASSVSFKDCGLSALSFPSGGFAFSGVLASSCLNRIWHGLHLFGEQRERRPCAVPDRSWVCYGTLQAGH